MVNVAQRWVGRERKVLEETCDFCSRWQLVTCERNEYGYPVWDHPRWTQMYDTGGPGYGCRIIDLTDCGCEPSLERRREVIDRIIHRTYAIRICSAAPQELVEFFGGE